MVDKLHGKAELLKLQPGAALNTFLNNVCTVVFIDIWLFIGIA